MLCLGGKLNIPDFLIERETELSSLRDNELSAILEFKKRAEEFEDVGKVFTKLDNFLKEQSKILEEQAAATAVKEEEDSNNIQEASQVVD